MTPYLIIFFTLPIRGDLTVTHSLPCVVLSKTTCAWRMTLNQDKYQFAQQWEGAKKFVLSGQLYQTAKSI